MDQLNELDEKCTVVVHQLALIQHRHSKWHDWFIKKKFLCEGDSVSFYSRFKREFEGKLRTRWLGPYQIDKVFDNGTVRLVTIDEKQMPLFANGHRL